MIQVDRLTKSYGPVTAVHDVSFNVEKGQIVGFLGPNGAGKSTTMKILACFMAASGGSARVAGFDVFSQSLEVRRRIGYLPENSPLYADLPVAAYLDFVAEAKGVPRGVRRSKVADVMDRCFVTDMQHRLIGKLSKGYRQRVGLAQALLGDPEVLILDEPTIGLDPRQIAEIRALIKSLGGQHTVILSTHILPEVSMVCDSIIIINRGRVVAKGTQAELVEQVFPAARVEVEVAGPAEAIALLAQGPARRDVGGSGGRLPVRSRVAARTRRASGARADGRGPRLGAPRAAPGRALPRGGLHPRRGGRGARAADLGDGGGGDAVRGWLPVFKKEMRLYFGSPVAYAVATFFLFIAAFFFAPSFIQYADVSMRSAMQPQMGQSLNATENILRPLTYNMAVVLLFFIPMLTMRLFAEEKRSGTMELLLTYPLRDGEVLAGKFLAALALYASILALTVTYPITVAWFTRIEWGAVLTGYLGLLLVGAAFLSIGLFVSSTTENQIVAGFGTFGTLLILWLLGWFADSAQGALRIAIQQAAIIEHMESFAKGVLDTKDLVYYLSVTAFALFLTLRSLESKRWRG